MLTENTFGDILSDVAAAVTGGLGLAASASLGDGGPGLFEPVRSGAPDRGAGDRQAGRHAALDGLMLRHGLDRPDAAEALKLAIDAGLREAPTPDLGGSASTSAMGDAVLRSLAA